MPASLKRIRDAMSVAPTAQDKGLTLTLTVVAYDAGLIQVDGVPMSSPDTGWIDAAETIVVTLNEFQRQVEKRRRT